MNGQALKTCLWSSPSSYFANEGTAAEREGTVLGYTRRHSWGWTQGLLTQGLAPSTVHQLEEAGMPVSVTKWHSDHRALGEFWGPKLPHPIMPQRSHSHW